MKSVYWNISSIYVISHFLAIARIASLEKTSVGEVIKTGSTSSFFFYLCVCVCLLLCFHACVFVVVLDLGIFWLKKCRLFRILYYHVLQECGVL